MRCSTLVAAGVAAVMLHALPVEAQVAKFRAQAVGISGPVRGQAAIVEITIDRWSTEEEAARLIGAFVEKGQREMLAELQKVKPPIGSVQVRGTPAYHLRYAARTALEDGGQQILIATDREMSMREVMDKPVSYNYPFTLIELIVDGNGEGEGRASIATKVVWDKKANVLELQNYNTAPVFLTKVDQIE